MELPGDLQYAKSHEWMRKEGDEAVIGITDHAQQALNDVVYVELPGVGDELDAGDVFGVVESVKSASDLYMPVAGEVIAVNEALEDTPELVNQDPYGDGWFIRIRITDPGGAEDLMDASEYQDSIE